jgi:hypothetical protein
MPSIPTPLAILLCDQVIIEMQTMKKTLVGLFDKLTTQEFPMVQRLGFYARLTDLDGTYTFTIRVISITGEEELIGSMESPPATSTDRLGLMELALNLPPMPFPKAGRYEFQLFANQDYIGRAVVDAVQQS